VTVTSGSPISSTLTISVQPATPKGTYSLTANATASGVSATTTVQLQVH
jgi:hypothetical protein